MLALSWQPAFCEYRPEKAECRDAQRRQPAGDRGAAVAARAVAAAGGERLLRRAGRARGAGRGLRGGATCPRSKSTTRPARPWRWRCPAPRAPRPARVDQARHLPPRPPAAPTNTTTTPCFVVDAINASPVAAYLAQRVGGEMLTAELRAGFDAAFGDGGRRPGAGAVRRRRRPDAGAASSGSGPRGSDRPGQRSRRPDAGGGAALRRLPARGDRPGGPAVAGPRRRPEARAGRDRIRRSGQRRPPPFGRSAARAIAR